MNCLHATQLLSESLERPLRPGERLRLHWHLTLCSACRQTGEQFRVLRRAARRYAGVEDEPPAD